MSKTIKNVKLTTRQFELLVAAMALMEATLSDMIEDGWEGYSERSYKTLENLRHKLGAWG